MTKLFPPFDPDEISRGRLFQLPQIPIRAILPNLVTLVALIAGLTSIRMAVEGRFDLAIYAIISAAILDGIDGRVARLLRATSRFGAQLDSLTDFVNFGVAPALTIYIWSLHDLNSVGWMVAMVFAICTGLRLARFNVGLEAPAKPDWQAGYFVGIPAPAGAVTVLLPLYLEFLGAPHGFWTAPVVLLYTLAIGLLMISTLPSWSGKMIGRRIPRDLVLPIFVAFVIVAALLVSFPWIVLTIIALGYLGGLPLSWRAWHERKEASETEASGTAARAVATPAPSAPPGRDTPSDIEDI